MKKLLSTVSIFIFLSLCVCCDSMIKEIDIKSATFPPKLCVTASLDGASGMFSILLHEGRAIADYKEPRPDGQEIKAYGTIRLYEDDIEIVNETGLFDMTIGYYQQDGMGSTRRERGGHRFEATVAAKPGSAYRLEVEVDGYSPIKSTSLMPFPPDISASIDTSSVIVIKNKIRYYSMDKEAYDLGVSDYAGHWMNKDFWPVSLQWGKRTAERNYYAVEILYTTGTLEENPNSSLYSPGVFVSDLSQLQDNPEVEIDNSQRVNIDPTNSPDMYHFETLLMSDIGFTDNNASLNLYQEKLKPYHLPPLSPEEIEQYQLEEVTTQHHTAYKVRVRQITPATFKYYRSLVMQSTGIAFFTEPVNIVGNIENGYGVFSEFNAATINVLDYHYATYSYHRKEE